MKKRKQKKINIPIQLYEGEYKGKEDIYLNGMIIQGTDSREKICCDCQKDKDYCPDCCDGDLYLSPDSY